MTSSIGRDMTRYGFNGGMYGKGHLVLEVVKEYIANNPSLELDILQTISPKQLQSLKNDC